MYAYHELTNRNASLITANFALITIVTKTQFGYLIVYVAMATQLKEWLPCVFRTQVRRS